MKTLVLIRHAKSDWGHSGLKDFDRPLNKRGMKDAPLMAKVLGEKGLTPDFILTSSANRAITTAKFFAEHFELSDGHFADNINIYRGNYRDYINLLNELDNKFNTVFLFGHNPEITYVASELLSDFSENVPTTGCIVIDFDIDDWIDIESGKSKLRFFDYPKNHK